MVFNYTSREKKALIIFILVLTLVFAFNDGQETFDLGFWLINFLKILVIVAIGALVHDLGHDLMCRKYGFNSEFRLWGMKRLGFTKHPLYPKTYNILGFKWTIYQFPLGILLALIVMVLSNGKLFWAAISSYGLVVERAHRLGRRYVEVTDFEEAKIALAGPMFLLALTLILKIFNGAGMFDKFILIYSLIVVYDMLPLPGLDGSKVYWGSRPLFAFSFVFTIAAIAAIYMLNVWIALLLALGLSLVFLVIYYYLKIYK
ncbi:MAG: hypothetical protein ABIB71_00680 [Candidatus Woesearchaeota archaeon]